MKKITLLLLIVSCTNPKMKIVEREKEIKRQYPFLDSITNHIANRIAENKQNEVNYPVIFSEPDMKRGEVIWLKRMGDSLQKYNDMKKSLMLEYDSLEFELKKY